MPRDAYVDANEYETSLSLSNDDYAEFMKGLKRDRDQTHNMVTKDINIILPGFEEDMFKVVQAQFIRRQKALGDCIDSIREALRKKEASLNSQENSHVEQRLMQMDLDYLRMFKKLAEKEKAKEDTLKRHVLEIFMSKFGNTVVELDTPE